MYEDGDGLRLAVALAVASVPLMATGWFAVWAWSFVKSFLTGEIEDTE